MHGLIAILVSLHLSFLAPVIKDAIVVAKNPIVRKDVKAAAKAVAAYERSRKKRVNAGVNDLRARHR
jgi:hypothetical protein